MNCGEMFEVDHQILACERASGHKGPHRAGLHALPTPPSEHPPAAGAGAREIGRGLDNVARAIIHLASVIEKQAELDRRMAGEP